MKRMLVGGGLALVVFAAGPVSGKECTVAALTDNCAVLKKQGSTQYISLGEGTLLRNPAYDQSYWSWVYTSNLPPTKITPARLAKMEELGRSAKASLISSIRQGRPEASLSLAEKSQIERIRTVKIKTQDDDSIRQGICGSAKPNAHYNGSTHQITLCAATMMLPESAIAFTLGHEIGHAIGPCAMEGPLLKNSDGTHGAQTLLSELRHEPVTSSAVAPAVPFSSYPQKEMADCLKTAGFGYNMNDAEARKFATQFMEMQPKFVAGTPAAEKEMVRILAVVKKYPVCFGGEGYGNSLNETVSDSFGARALADHLEKYPANNAEARIGVFANFLSEACGFQAPEKADGVHPPSHRRIEKVLLSLPKIQRTFGCSSKTVSCDQQQASVVDAGAAATEDLQGRD